MFTGIGSVGAARRLQSAAVLRRLLLLPKRPLAAVFCTAVLLVGSPADFIFAGEPIGKPSTSRSARDEALRVIPLDKLPAEARGKVTAVLDNVSLYRRLPIQSIDCEPDMFRFIMDNPDVMVNMWRVMGVTNVSLDRVDANHFRCTDGDGTTARVEVLLRTPQLQIIFAEGLYDGPLFPRPIRGQCVAVLQYTTNRKASGRFEETAQLDTFLHVDNFGVELLTKLFQGLVGRTIDHNFVETVSFIGSVSRTAELNPRGMRHMAARLDRVDSDRREQLVAVSDQVAGKLAGVKYSEDEENPPLSEIVQSTAVDAPAGKASKR
ncbi:MAG TPA: hypothetical protein VFE46_20125 [Pirellulales bacterium]|jgi:hypothetical protein|nr:hypothetical protein [Pirellulales bacterium]